MAHTDCAIYKDSLFIYAASYVEAYIWAPPGPGAAALPSAGPVVAASIRRGTYHTCCSEYTRMLPASDSVNVNVHVDVSVSAVVVVVGGAIFWQRLPPNLGQQSQAAHMCNHATAHP